MRVKVLLKKLTDGEAQFISLVRRGANGMPFRIQKAGADKDLDLSKPAEIFKDAQVVEPDPVPPVEEKKEAPTEPVAAAQSDKTEENKETAVSTETDTKVAAPVVETPPVVEPPKDEVEKACGDEADKKKMKKEDEVPVVETPAVVTPPAPPAGPSMADVLAAVQGLTSQLASIQKSVDEKIAGIDAQVKAVVQKSAEVEAKVASTVVAPPPAGDEPAKVEVKKSADRTDDFDVREGYFDTAFHSIKR